MLLTIIKHIHFVYDFQYPPQGQFSEWHARTFFRRRWGIHVMNNVGGLFLLPGIAYAQVLLQLADIAGAEEDIVILPFSFRY